MDQQKRTFHIETAIEAYEGYIPDGWFQQVGSQIQDNTLLQRLFFDLVISWTSIAYTAQMPANSVQAMHRTTLGRGAFVSSDGSVINFSEQIVSKLAKRLPKVEQSHSLRTKILRVLKIIATEYRDNVNVSKDQIPLKFMWNTFMQQDEFKLSIWNSQRVSYLAFYNAYEAFLIDCLKAGTRSRSLRVTDRPAFKSALNNALSESISEQCWADNRINIARLVRHALSHNGGRVTSDLNKQNHGIKIIGVDLQIVPDDIHRMLASLRTAVERIVLLARTDDDFLQADDGVPPEGE